MAKTFSSMLPLGTPAPQFSLPDPADGSLWQFSKFPHATAYLVIFIANHCPYVVHVADGIAKMAADFQTSGVAVVAINSNDIQAYPEDSPEHMKAFAKKHNFSFPYLFDETQEVARAFDAACTPDFFLFDEKKRLVYRGQMDSSRPGNGVPNDGHDLRAAVRDLLAHRKISPEQRPSLGCNIKWKAQQTSSRL